MSISAGGQTSPQLDVWKMAGGVNTPLTYKMLALVAAGQLTLQFTGIIGNAIVSSISVSPADQSSTIFMSPIVPTQYWSNCQPDGEQKFMLDAQGYLSICVRKLTGNVWMRSTMPFVEVIQ